MSYGVLKFRLPDELDEFEQAQKAGAYIARIEDFRNYLRSLAKYGEMTEIEHNKTCEIREKFFEIFGDVL
jgi:hypothetical protein